MHRRKRFLLALSLLLALFALQGTALAHKEAEAPASPAAEALPAEAAAEEVSAPAQEGETPQEATDFDRAEDAAEPETEATEEDAAAEAQAAEEAAEAAEALPEGFDAFPDVAGHWAAESLRWAYEHGLLQGFQDGSLRPDAPVNRAEALTVLTRLLRAQQQSSLALQLPEGGDWYAEALRKGLSLGLVGEGDTAGMETALTRLELFHMLNAAFLLRGGAEMPELSAYADLGHCSDWERQEIGFLLSAGYLQGYEGRLQPYAPLTRAEFVTILERIVPHLDADADSLPETGGARLSGAVDLGGKILHAPLLLDCESSALTLRDTQAESLHLLSQELSALELRGETRIASLRIGGGNGETLHISTKEGAVVERLIIDSHRGAVTVSGAVKTLILRGEGQVTVDAQCLEQILLFGETELRLNSPLPELLLYGGSSTLSGSGSIATLTHYHGSYEILSEKLSPAEQADETDPGIAGLTLEGSAPEWLPIGAPLRFTVQVSNPLPRQLTLDWYLDGEKLHSEKGLVTPEGNSFAFTYPVEYKRAMKTQRELRCELTYRDFFGSKSSAELRRSVTLENYANAYYDREALSQVSTGYQGDYTLEWALEHDYEDSVKVAWINAKGYGSPTEYLIWINLSHQRVNIFQGKAGDWSLIRSCLMGSGRSGHSTPVGFYSITGRSARGWITSTYNVHPVTNFTNARYTQMAFHSRKYNPAMTKMIDPRIGFPISDGCIRMYDEDAWWIFEHIPHHTAVVVF